MKELTIEQKAKAYDEALEKAREYWETDNDNTLDVKAKGTMEYLFPILKDSEDERIKDEIVLYIGAKDDISLDTHNKWLSWLEKQGQEWSEEDESMYTRTLGIFGKCYMGELPTKVEEELNWFKTLKQRIGV